ncbi:GumC family protein [Vampirovibrio chlorellavorus]|uniref:GumC family protein n=1 Tax=Vampirovibrio chlorellavorus TaxID=758823 RepID=UPI0026E99D73|nr:hypothetical protein [Vampirovibrio chlorellavorus]
MDSIFLVLKRHRWLATAIFCFSFLTVVLIHFLSAPVYEVKSSVYIQRKIPNQYQAYEYDDTLDHIRILKSNLVLDKVVSRLRKEFPKREDVAQDLLLRRLRADSNVSTELSQVTKVIDLYFQDTSAHFAKKVLDHTLKSYEEALAHIAQETRLKGIDFLKVRLAEVQRNRHQLAENLKQVEAASGTTDIDLKNSELVKLKSNFTQLLGTTSAEILATEKQIKHLERILGLSPAQVQRLVSIKSDPKLEIWQKQLAMEKGELAKLKSAFTDSYPVVLEKEDLIQRLERLIGQRIQSSYSQNIHPAALVGEDKAFSDLDVTFGKQLIELTTQRAALLQQKSYYESFLSQLDSGFKAVAFEKKDMDDLRLALNALKSEEEKLQDKIQETILEQASLLNLGAFVVLTPPIEPEQGDAVFPISLKTTLILGGMASLVLALSSVAIAEFLDPRIPLLERPGLSLGSFSGRLPRTTETLYEELAALGQGIALQIRKRGIQTLLFISLFDNADSRCALPIYVDGSGKKPEMFWHPGNLASVLSGLYAFKHPELKVLYFTQRAAELDGFALFNPFRNKRLVLKLGRLELYRSCTQENLYQLLAETVDEDILDPGFLKNLQAQQGFHLIFLHPWMSATGGNPVAGQPAAIERQNRVALIEDIADGVILGISKSASDVRELKFLESSIQPEQIVGNVVFP